MKFDSRKMSKKRFVLLTIGFVFMVGLPILINLAFFKPTKINAFIAAKIYSAPANQAFTDDNFYQCVVDSYNGTYGTSIAYTENLTDLQLANITQLKCGQKNITSVDGLEKLVNITYLYFSYNNLTNIDLSSNLKLNMVFLDHNKLTDVDVSKNTVLTSLNVWDNSLTEIDVSNNTGLTILNVANNKLTEIDVSKNTMLQQLDVKNNNITSLNVNNNVRLSWLQADNNKLSSIDLSKNTSLTSLTISNNDFNSINIDNNLLLQSLVVSNNELNTLDVSRHTSLTDLTANNIGLTSIDLSKNTKLIGLNLTNNKLSKLDLKNNTSLMQLDIKNNSIEELDVSKSSQLYLLDVNNNNLKTLTFSGASLKYLYANNNQLTTIDLTKCTVLDSLYLNNNNITTLNVGNNTKLFQLYVNENELSSIDVSKNTVLKYLSLNKNKLTSIDVSKNTVLEYLYLSDNQLTKIDVSKNTALIVLDLRSNPIPPIIDLSNNTSLGKYSGSYLPTFDGGKTTVIYKNTEYYVTDDLINSNLSLVKFPSGSKEVSFYSVSGSKDLKIINKRTIKSSVIGDYYYSVGYSAPIYYYVSYGLKVIEITSDKYTINDTENWIYVGSDNTINEIKKNIVVPNGITLSVDLNNNKLSVLNGSEVLKEFDILKNSSDKYTVNDTENYIYVGTDNDVNTIKNNITVSSDLALTVDLNQDKIKVLKGTTILKEYDIFKINSEGYTIDDDESWIYVATDNANDTIKNSITVSNGLTVSVDLVNNLVKVLKGNTLLKQYSILKLSSTKYGINKNEGYIYVGADNVNDTIKNNITVSSGLTLSVDLTNNLVKVFKNSTTLDEFAILKISSTRYAINETENYIYVAADSDINVIKNNITVSDGLTVSVDLTNDLVKVLKGSTLLKQYSILKVSSTKYSINNNEKYIYVGTDDMVSGITVSNGLMLFVDSTVVKVLKDSVTLDEFAVLSISSTKYKINENEGYIYVGADSDVDTIKNSITASDGLTVNVDLTNDKINVLKGSTLLKQFNILKVSSTKYKINENECYIYLGEDNTVDVIKDNITVSSGLIIDVDLTNNNVVIVKKGTTVLKRYHILNFSSNEYVINGDANYLYVGTDNSELTIKNNLIIPSGMSVDINLNTNKLKLLKGSQVLDEYDILKISSTKYEINDDQNYIYIGVDSNVNTIKNNITVSDGLTLSVDLTDNIVKVSKGSLMLKEYDVLRFYSDVYDLNKNYIYTGVNSLDLNDINVVNLSKTIKDNNLLINYGEETYASYSLVGININNYKVNGKMITISGEVSYSDFISNINTNGVIYKIFNGDSEITSGNISGDMTLKIYKDVDLVDEYVFTDEYLEFDDKLNVNETNKSISKLKEKVTVNTILSSVDTSGKVTIMHKTGKELTDKSLVGTGSKVIIELASETIEYTLVVSGDVTGDGVINIADVVKLADHTLSGNVLDKYEKTAAEITGNNTLNIADVVKLADYTLNKSIEIWR